MTRSKVVFFEKYFQARRRAKERSRFIVGELRKAAADNGISEEIMFSGGPDEEGLAEIFFQVELVSEEVRAKNGSEK